jgi:hypothetical protein
MVIAGMYTEGEGTKHRPEHILDSLTVRHVCTKCNNGWMNDLEEWFEKRLGYLIEPEWPRLANEFIEVARPESHRLAQWLMKTAIMFNLAAMKGKLRVDFPTDVVSAVSVGKIPEYNWVDLGFPRLSTVGCAIGKCFRAVNGGKYCRSQIFSGFGFSFGVQFNHLLLRIARAPGTVVDYDPALGGPSLRLYPVPDRQLTVVPKYADIMKFTHAVVLKTWRGCQGNIPKTPH